MHHCIGPKPVWKLVWTEACQNIWMCMCVSTWKKCFEVLGTKESLEPSSSLHWPAAMVGLIGGDEHVENFGRQHEKPPLEMSIVWVTPSGSENLPDSGTSRHGSNTLQSPIRERAIYCREQARAHFPIIRNLKLCLLGFRFKHVSPFVFMSLCYLVNVISRNTILEDFGFVLWLLL